MAIGSLTKPEHGLLLHGLSARNKLSRRNYEAVMAWGTNAKLDSDLLVLVFERYVEIDVDDSGELRFLPTELGLASPRRGELERMGA